MKSIIRPINIVIISLLAFSLLFTGCTKKGNLDEDLSTLKENKIQEGQSLAEQMKTNEPKLGKTIVIETTKGIIKFGLYEEDAPITTKNFIDLTNKGFYNGLTFHRYEPGFVIQGGDPRGDGTGGSNKTIPLEVNPKLKHIMGALGMARSQDPNSASSQFYIVTGEASFLDGNYAIFGIVTEGLDVAKSLRAGDKMTKVTVQ